MVLENVNNSPIIIRVAEEIESAVDQTGLNTLLEFCWTSQRCLRRVFLVTFQGGVEKPFIL